MGKTVLTKTHETDMGYTVVLRETANGGYEILAGGRPVTKGNGEPWEYRVLSKALGRFDREVAKVEGWEAKLKVAGLWHPIRLCAGGCGLEMRVTDREFPDGTVETVQEQLDRGDERRCVRCGPFPPILYWKDEGEGGPAWLIPYRDRNRFGREETTDVEHFPEWLSRREAEALAEERGATFFAHLDFMTATKEEEDR